LLLATRVVADPQRHGGEAGQVWIAVAKAAPAPAGTTE